MSLETILFDVNDSVATVTLNRPSSLNAFNDQMIKEAFVAVRQSGRDAAVRAIVITGAGRAFSSGQDLKDVQDRKENFSIGEHLRTGYNRLITSIISAEKPVIAAVNGVAAGAGCGVALAADLRIASHKGQLYPGFQPSWLGARQWFDLDAAKINRLQPGISNGDYGRTGLG